MVFAGTENKIRCQSSPGCVELSSDSCWSRSYTWLEIENFLDTQVIIEKKCLDTVGLTLVEKRALLFFAPKRFSTGFGTNRR
jgi:hypothetical protein